MYRVEVEWAPAYELVVSFQAFFSKSEQRHLDIGPNWAKSLKRELGPEVTARLGSQGMSSLWDAMVPMLHACPDRETVDGFLSWVDSLSVEDVRSLLPADSELCIDVSTDALSRSMQSTMSALSEWNTRYFSQIDPAILSGLKQEAERRRAVVSGVDPLLAVEAATQGVFYEPRQEPAVVLLVPQWHFRPWNIFGEFDGHYLFEYPADVLPSQDSELPLSLLRLTRALGDESRLRILRLVAEQPRSFTDLVRLTGLSKSTVNHHTVMLRAAGLIAVHASGGKGDTYTLREQQLDTLGTTLRRYLMGGR
jgi:DNA-binding transcriptional ArsR family regulator